jgi:uncharacterized Zn finger protein
LRSADAAATRRLEPALLRRLAGNRSYDRGADYYAAGAVGSLAIDGESAVATVNGSYDYRVRLDIDGDDIDFSCTCPVGQDGEFCKHAVAVALAWRGQSSTPQTGSRARRTKRDTANPTMDDLREYLRAQEKDALVELLIGRAMEDEPLRERLFLQLARDRPRGPDLRAFRSAMKRAIRVRDFVDYAASFDYASRVANLVEQLARLLEDGHAAAVIELAEEALSELEAAIEMIDDSDGAVGGILEALQDLHRDACEIARPDPNALARRLFAREISSDWDVFGGAAARYADVLGERGLAVYREMAEREWAKLPALRPGDHEDAWTERYRITRIMEILAEQSGDLEARVAVKARDLSLPYGFLQVAELYRDAGEHDRALEWAERGIAAFPERSDPRLVAFLLAEYHRRGRFADVMDRVWQEFARSANLESYQRLKDHAERIGCWGEWRARAIGLLRQQIEERKSQPPREYRFGPRIRPDHSELVRILLWEDNTEAAWQEAQVGGCSEELWLRLADLREAEHPADGVPIYRRQIGPILARTNRDAYAEAVRLLRRIHSLHVRLGREAEFQTDLRDLRAAHARKRNFLRMLDAAGFGTGDVKTPPQPAELPLPSGS